MLNNKEAVADTFALITFSLIIGFGVELVIAKLSVEQSIYSRLLSIPVNFVIARPYGLYRDWILSGAKNYSGKLKIMSILLDALAFVSFQIPVYATLVSLTGATQYQILQACLGQIAVMAFMGPPYGWYLQWCRKHNIIFYFIRFSKP